MNNTETIDILEKLIDRYEYAINSSESYSDTNEYKDFLTDINCEHGVCACAQYNFGILIYNEDWTGVGYWFVPPYPLTNREEIIESLKYRLNKLNAILNEKK